MKKLSLSLVLCLSMAFVFGQTSKPLEYSSVTPVEKVLASELYLRALAWFATSFQSANDVIQFKDPQAGKIIGRAVHSYNPNVFMSSACTKGYIDYNIVVEVKDGRYKLTLNSFSHRYIGYGCQGPPYSFGTILDDEFCNTTQYSGFNAPKSWLRNVCADIRAQLDNLSVSLSGGLAKSMAIPSSPSDSDW